MTEIPRRCPSCGLILLKGAIFDAFDKKELYGPILGLHDNADMESAQAGYIGMSSMMLYDRAPEMYRCPRCGTDPVTGERLPVRSISPAFEAELNALVLEGKPLEAMVRLQSNTNWSSRESKDWITNREKWLKRKPCPFCERILPHPEALQCFECGMDWHDPSNPVKREPNNR